MSINFFCSKNICIKLVEEMAKKGKKRILVFSPAFVADCLETTDELGHELVNEAKHWGGNIYPIECLNTKENWCKDLSLIHI